MNEALLSDLVFFNWAVLFYCHVQVLYVLIDLREFAETSDRQIEGFVGTYNFELKRFRVASDLRGEELYVKLFRLFGTQDPTSDSVCHRR